MALNLITSLGPHCQAVYLDPFAAAKTWRKFSLKIKQMKQKESLNSRHHKIQSSFTATAQVQHDLYMDMQKEII